MSFANFDRILDRASPRDAGAPSVSDLSACLSDLAKALLEVDRRMDRIHDLLPPKVRRAIDSEQFFDTFLAYRAMKVHAATLQGMADAEAGRSLCPYPSLQRSERDAWLSARSDFKSGTAEKAA